MDLVNTLVKKTSKSESYARKIIDSWKNANLVTTTKKGKNVIEF